MQAIYKRYRLKSDNSSFTVFFIMYFYFLGKPLRFGFKAWSLCTPSGYMVNFEIYQGKNPRSQSAYEDRFGKCAAPLINMIDDFSSDVKALPFSFYFDNLFTSFPLLAYLKSRGYNGTGTIRENRIPSSCPLPHKSKLKKKQRGYYESIKINETDIRLTKWNDNAVVCIASTVHGVNPKSSALRYSKEKKKKISVARPCAVAEYNKYMCGVDRFDQNVSLYRIAHRGKKWWSSIFTWIIDACVENAWQLHRKCEPKMTQFEFRRQIAIYYCRLNGVAPKSRGPKTAHRLCNDEKTVQYALRYDHIDHLVVSLANKRRCAGELCKSIMRTGCSKCNVGLCINCFANFHTKQ